MNNKQDILNELKTLSNVLLNTKENEKSLSVPENYFEELTDIVLFQASNESYKLNQLRKDKNEVPSDYFENFGDTILSKINIEEKASLQKEQVDLPIQNSRIIELFKRVAMAATIVGAVFLVKQVQQPAPIVNDCSDGIACLTQDEIYNYMNANSHEFDVQDVQETVKPIIEKTETKSNIDKSDAVKYIETNKNILDVDDASTDIF